MSRSLRWSDCRAGAGSALGHRQGKAVLCEVSVTRPGGSWLREKTEQGEDGGLGLLPLAEVDHSQFLQLMNNFISYIVQLLRA